MKTAEKIPCKIVKLISEHGSMVSSEIAAMLDIDQDAVFNATRRAIRQGLLKSDKVTLAGYKDSRLFNRYSVASKFDPISDNKKIVPYDVKAEQKRQDYARAQQQGEPTGIPKSIMKTPHVDHEAVPAFECGYTPTGSFLMIRNGNYSMTLSADEAEAVKRCMELFP